MSPTSAPVQLFSTPCVSPSHAPLGLGIVAAQLRAAGIETEVHHPNLTFFARLCQTLGHRTAARLYEVGEVLEVAAGLLYRQSAHPFDPTELLVPFLDARGVDEDTFWTTVRLLKRFTAETLTRLDVGSVQVAGFTLTIRQTMCSLYFAQQLKARAPHVTVVFGGSTCEDPMGLALFAAHPVIDVLVRGEADTSIVPVFESLLAGSTDGSGDLSSIPNVAFRRTGSVVATEPAMIDMTEAVAPDHTDFMAAYRAVEALTREPANLYLEASRGCWWGAKKHCTFCGIHTSAIEFRHKPAAEVVEEVTALLDRHRVFRFVLADTILAREHFDDLLPRLAELRRRHDVEFLVDVKSPLSRRDVQVLRHAGCIALQVGIEALSDRLLRLMAKGNTALQQIQSIRLCTEAGILPFYAILTHVPGEEPADYVETLRNLRSMRHLAPPSGVFPIEINRYSPYFKGWEELGFDRPQPAEYYRLMFGPDGTDLDDFAYHFQGRHPSTRSAALDEARGRVEAFVEEWRREPYASHLSFRAGRGFVRITRSEGRSRTVTELEGPHAELFLACDQIRTLRELRLRFDGVFTEDELRATLRDWVDRGLLAAASRGEVFLALPVAEHVPVDLIEHGPVRRARIPVIAS